MPLGRHRDHRVDVIGVLVANVIPLVGVLVGGWNAAALISLYWFESALVVCWSLFRAVLAGSPVENGAWRDQFITGPLSDKRLAIPVPWTEIRIHLSNVIFVLVLTPVAAVGWYTIGAVPLAAAGAERLSASDLDGVVVALAALFVLEGGRTAIGYLGRGGYHDHDAATAVRGVLVRATVVLAAAWTATLVTAGAVAESPEQSIGELDSTAIGSAVLSAVVLGKLTLDLADLYRDRLIEFYSDRVHDFESSGVGQWLSYEPTTPPTIDPTVPNPYERFLPSLRGRLLGWIPRVTDWSGAWFLAVMTVLATPLFALAGAPGAFAVTVAGVTTVACAVAAVDHWLRYGAVEYRVGADTIVAYDRLFRTAIWRIDDPSAVSVRVERDRIDRLLGTATVVVECDDELRRLPHLSSTDSVIKALSCEMGQ